MKNRLLFILSMLLVLTLYSCVRHKDVQGNNNYVSTVNETTTVASTQDNNKSIERPVIDRDLYGVWEIKRVIFISPISQYTSAEVNSILGKKITYSKDFAQYDGGNKVKPFYTYSVLESKDLISKEKVSLENLGINGKTITSVGVYENDLLTKRWGDVGNALYVKEDLSLILYEKCAYYELKKVGEVNGSSSGNIVDKSMLKIGDKFLSLTVSSLDMKDGSLRDATFSGTLEILGAYKWWPNEDGDGEMLVFMVDDINSIPTLKDVNNMRTIVMRNVETAKKLLPEDSGRARITITNYSIGERQITTTANIVSVIDRI